MSAAWGLAEVLALRDRAARERKQSYFVEGVRFLVAASDAGAHFRSLVTSPPLLRSPLGQMLARRLRQRGVPELRLPAEAFAQLARAPEPQGVGAVLAQSWAPLPQPGPRDLWVALGEVRSPGNLGTLMRTCAAAGAQGVIVPRSGADPFDPAAVRGSMGALHSLALARADPPELSAWKRRTGLWVAGATPQGAVDYRAVSYRRPTLLVLGSERKGLTEAQLSLCDARVRIPMAGGDSLNLAVAGSVLLYEAWSQRHPLPG